MAIVLRLNIAKPNNYAFFCPVTKLHLTLTNPVGTTDRVSAYILRGLKSKSLIDVNNVVDLETGKVNAKNKKSEPEVVAQPIKSETTATQEQKEEPSQEVEAAVDDKKKRGRRAQSNPVDEVAE